MSTKETLLTEHLSQYVSEHKKEFIDRVLTERTRQVTIVLEDVYQSQNVSAVIRTSECLGLQDVHIIERENKFGTNKQVLKGANKWLDLHRYKLKGFNNTEICFRQLRESGYRVLVTDPDPDGRSIYDVDVSQKIAIVMGSEHRGASDYALTHADQKVFIPMHGFTESLNISVSAAICLNILTTKMRQSNSTWRLTPEEQEVLRLQWYRKIVRRSDLIEKEFLLTIM